MAKGGPFLESDELFSIDLKTWLCLTFNHLLILFIGILMHYTGKSELGLTFDCKMEASFNAYNNLDFFMSL